MIKKISMIVTLITGLAFAAENPSEWLKADERTRDAVVQVWSQGTTFNWFYPFRSPEQHAGAGSGFFIDADGHFLTNYHVVRAATTVYITIPSMGKVLLGTEIVGVCPDLDVALLKLTAESKAKIIAERGAINWLTFGDSDALYVTQSILALGYPLGLRTLKSTVGCVAGRDFHLGASLIHITAPINPGNSGGPLVNHNGEVVGINTAQYTNAQNYNYVVPANELLVVLSDLYTTKLVRRPDYGMGKNRGVQALAQSMKNPVPGGLYVNYVYKDSMEERAGLKAGDMLYEIEFNGSRYRLDEFGDVVVPWRPNQKISFEELLVRCHIGDPLLLVIYRNGKRVELKAAFESSTLKPVRMIYPEYESNELDYEMFGGLVVMQLRANHLEVLAHQQQPLPYKELNDYRFPENRSKPALLISCVLPGSPAYLTDCLQQGYILDMVNGQKVTTLKELRKALLMSITTGEIALTTKDHTVTVLKLSDVLNDEPILARNFMYPISETIKQIQAKYTKK